MGLPLRLRPHPRRPMTALKPSCFGVLARWRRPSQQWALGSARLHSAWPMWCCSPTLIGWEMGLRPLCSAAAQAPLWQFPGPVGLAAALHGLPGVGHLLPGGLAARLTSVALFPLRPRESCGGPDLATLVSGISRGVAGHDETISEQPGGQKAPATGPADRCFEGVYGSYTITDTDRRGLPLGYRSRPAG